MSTVSPSALEVLHYLDVLTGISDHLSFDELLAIRLSRVRL
jgi:hypothetical protein